AVDFVEQRASRDRVGPRVWGHEHRGQLVVRAHVPAQGSEYGIHEGSRTNDVLHTVDLRQRDLLRGGDGDRVPADEKISRSAQHPGNGYQLGVWMEFAERTANWRTTVMFGPGGTNEADRGSPSMSSRVAPAATRSSRPTLSIIDCLHRAA